MNTISDSLKHGARKSLFIFYYVGHAISGPNGQLYLVLNDYKGDPSKDIGPDYIHGLSPDQITTPFQPLYEILNNLTDTLKPIKGLFPISKIEQTLNNTKTPIIILIDACYGHEQISDLRNKLYLTETGDYFGPDDYGGPNEFLNYSRAIRRFGDPGYLRSKNVIILSSSPGSVAIEVPNPGPNFLTKQYVAPLARRTYTHFEYIYLFSDSLTFGEFFNSIVDVKLIGRVNIKGTTSWSDFSDINKIYMLAK